MSFSVREEIVMVILSVTDGTDTVLFDWEFMLYFSYWRKGRRKKWVVL